jgi:hypothetical protein
MSAGAVRFQPDSRVSNDTRQEQCFEFSSNSSEEDPGHDCAISDSEVGGEIAMSSPIATAQSAQKKGEVLPPPAPLFFEREESEGWYVSDESERETPKSGTSLHLKHPPPQFSSLCSESEPFSNITTPVALDSREWEKSQISPKSKVSSGGYPEGLQGKLVYDCIALNAHRRTRRNDSSPFYKLSSEQDTTILFDSLFESGNLYQGVPRILCILLALNFSNTLFCIICSDLFSTISDFFHCKWSYTHYSVPFTNSKGR